MIRLAMPKKPSLLAADLKDIHTYLKNDLTRDAVSYVEQSETEEALSLRRIHARCNVRTQPTYTLTAHAPSASPPNTDPTPPYL